MTAHSEVPDFVRHTAGGLKHEPSQTIALSRLENGDIFGQILGVTVPDGKPFRVGFCWTPDDVRAIADFLIAPDVGF